MDRAPHQHRNPSPSLEACAYCNGTDDDRGCGALVPIRNFIGEPHPYFIPYLIDGRFQPAPGEPWRLMRPDEWQRCCEWLRAQIARERAIVAEEFANQQGGDDVATERTE